MFLISNGKLILDIFNKNQITIKIVSNIRNMTKSFFWNDKKIENLQEGAETGRKGSELFWDITTEKFYTFP